MSDASAPADTDTPALAPGWDAEDVRLLRELAQYGMTLVRELVNDVQEGLAAVQDARAAGQAAPHLTQSQAAKVALDFARLSRSVRLSLALKAHALGDPGDARRAGGSPVQPETWTETVKVDYDPDAPGTPDVDDILAREDFRCGRIRDELDHAISDPRHEPAEVERLREALESRIEVEREREHFLERSSPRLVERIALDLG